MLTELETYVPPIKITMNIVALGKAPETVVCPGCQVTNIEANALMIDRNTIRVLIVDDHKQVREGLKAFLLATEGLELAGEAVNGLEAIRLCDELQPDVVLMDLMMPEMGGINATRTIHNRYPDLPILVLSTFADRATERLALRVGAVACLSKQISFDELAAAIRSAVADARSNPQ